MSRCARPSDPQATAAPRLRVRLPGALRSLAGEAAEVEVRARTVGDALGELVRLHPSLLRHLRTETGELREHVNVFLSEEDVRYLDGLDTRVADGQELYIIPSIAGG